MNAIRLFCLLSVTAWIPVTFAMPDKLSGDVTAADWLSRMATALREQSYQGIFTYMRGGQFESMHIAHKFEDGQEIERMFQLNGETLEILRKGDEVVCRHEDSGHVDLQHHVPMGPFSNAFNESLSAYQDLYRFSLHGEGRIAGRTAVKLAISPSNDDRYGYRLWLDKETGLLLQSHMIDVDKKRVREIFQFSSIEIGEDVESAELVSSLGESSVQHRLAGEVLGMPPGDAVKPLWRVAWLPNGFQPVEVTGSNRLHFTDGIATFSVFIDRGSSAELPDLATQVGGTVVISRHLNGGNITVVGEVPIRTARKVAESVEPVIY